MNKKHVKVTYAGYVAITSELTVNNDKFFNIFQQNAEVFKLPAEEGLCILFAHKIHFVDEFNQ